MQEHSRKPLAAGHVIGGYSIVRVVGQGGFGIVYEAVNEYTRERVAIKQFYPNSIASWRHGTIVVDKDDDKELVDKILKRFQEEAALQFSFSHPNILKVKNFVPADNTGYMISEYIDGESLVDYLKQYNSVFPDELTFRRMMEPILSALAYVHEKLTLHRDISPDNIMIDNFGKAILVDFGAAKLDLRRSPSPSSIVAYREEYAPIEQQVPSEERPEGYYTDLFAMAGTMYRLLSGKPPTRAIERQLSGKDPYIPLAQSSKVKCSQSVFDGIDRGLAMDIKQRPATVQHFASMLGWGTEALPLPAPLPQPQASPPPGPTVTTGTTLVAGNTEPAPPKKRSNWKSYAAMLVVLSAVIAGFVLLSAENQNTVDTTPAPPRPATVTPPPGVAPPAVAPRPPAITAPPPAAPVITAPTPATPTPPPPNPRIALEDSLYRTALECMRNSTSCNIDFCLTQYRASIGFSDRYPILRGEYNRLTQSPRCSPAPAPPVVAPPSPRLTFRTIENRDMDGGDLNEPFQRDVTLDACQTSCQEKSECVGLAYDKITRTCYLKAEVKILRFDPTSTAMIRSDKATPALSPLPVRIERRTATYSGNRYSTSNSPSRLACSNTCESETSCLGYVYTGGQCWRYDRIDSGVRDPQTQAGIRKQPDP